MTTTPSHGIRVLIVDDDWGARTSLEAVLGEHFTVQGVMDAHAAERLLGLETYHVVLADYRLPGRTGLDLLRAVATRSPFTVGILITGHADAPEVQGAKRDNELFHVVSK